MWVFKYKFDNKSFLIKHKIKLYAQNNLQYIDQNVYAITLIIKIFKIVIIVVIAFNIKTRQYNAINAFANNNIDEFTYIKIFEDWKK